MSLSVAHQRFREPNSPRPVLSDHLRSRPHWSGSRPPFMETTLHRQLKKHYGGEAACCEVRLGSYRIDAVADGRLIEIQSAPLGAIRDKIRTLLEQHDVLVIKPLAARK